jgi:membrane protease YdiL (CAAX protease family)
MEPSYIASRHPLVQLLFAILITLISFIVISLLSLIPAIFLFQVPLSSLMSGLDSTNPDTIPLLKYLQISQAFGLFIVPPIVIGWFMARNSWKYLEVDKKPDEKRAGLVFIILISVLPALNLLAMLNESLQLPGFLSGLERWMQRTEAQAGDMTTAFLTVNTFGGYLINVLMIALLPAFGEEFFFRGVLQKMMIKWFRNPHWAILVTAIIFSAFHMQFYGFLPRLLQGLLFGYLVFWSGNLWYAIIAHFINNFMPVTATYMYPDRFSPDQLDQLGSGPSAWLWAFPATLIAVGAIYYFYQKTRIVVHDECAN